MVEVIQRPAHDHQRLRQNTQVPAAAHAGTRASKAYAPEARVLVANAASRSSWWPSFKPTGIPDSRHCFPPPPPGLDVSWTWTEISNHWSWRLLCAPLPHHAPAGCDVNHSPNWRDPIALAGAMSRHSPAASVRCQFTSSTSGILNALVQNASSGHIKPEPEVGLLAIVAADARTGSRSRTPRRWR
jgi:hypothetical protein